MNNAEKYYEENEDFRAYVDKHARDRKITKEEALTHALVLNVMEYYQSEK